ncbi:GNAT family N-acetyltransferase [Providencia manganoxydans]|uniref:GNAT family N-acetyltransferase n=2 Tax=Providencia TaxID=586 RepID=A0A1S1HSJ5_PROST|nr:MULTISPECIES: GNAT family N-acetyltransferase [Providencia]MDV5227500.1 GNAT family N-acetyltransferase [Providencia rettgeri]ELR5041300.1 GNAT family N-acetyltransferase [Providencia stuartii]ELR5081868.1 GNAT family N-acetyltransferase [Providencia stuartii]ELR5113667.1 GNAT family N-acetyltransferase [Providencia stuartii]MDX4945730.1 GNAT family N-acetyltransferase [Providencia manganoxydans]
MRKIRELQRDEIPSVWSIDRTELIEHLYLHEKGQLVLSAQRFDMKGWPEGEPEAYTPHLLESYDNGAVFIGVFDENTLIAAASLDNIWRGEAHNLLQLSFLHVSKHYRGEGLGGMLFKRCCQLAKEKKAEGLYISATPSENTVHFYQYMGCKLIDKPDPELFALEPEDIHFIYPF